MEVSDKVETFFLQGTRIISTYPSVSERYYKHKHYPSSESNEKSNQDLLVLAHSNRIAIVTIAPTHDILRLKKNVTKIDFGADKINRLENKVKGKWKKGGQKVQNQSVLCSIECDDGSIYKISACITGKIIEINRQLIEEPGLLARKVFIWNHELIITYCFHCSHGVMVLSQYYSHLFHQQKYQI